MEKIIRRTSLHGALLIAVLAFSNQQATAAGNADAGKAAFKKCASCHQVGPSAHGGFGPQLTGVIGRPAGTTKDYSYSDAMKKSGIVWNEQTLTAFLRAPSTVVPGTNMRFWGIGDDQQIADILAYLKTFQ